MLHLCTFTPLKIYNGTPEGVPLEIQWQQLPINELNGTPLKGACPISNLHRCKTPILEDKKICKGVIYIIKKYRKCICNNYQKQIRDMKCYQIC